MTKLEMFNELEQEALEGREEDNVLPEDDEDAEKETQTLEVEPE